MRVQSIYEPLGYASNQSIRADVAEISRSGSGYYRQRRSGERDRRRVEPRRAPPTVAEQAEPSPLPSTTLAATVASLGIGTPIGAQATCFHVNAAYIEGD